MVDLRERGLRNPHHSFAVVTNTRSLQPIFAAPVRPMETIVGFRTQLDAWLTNPVHLPWMPGLECEVGIWKVPVSALGDYFTDMFVADFEDESDAILAADWVSGTGLQLAPGPVSDQGPKSQSALQNRSRMWAGEYGDVDTAVTPNAARTFTPYVSAATYHVARSFYELELEVGGTHPNVLANRGNKDLWQNPPAVAHRIAGMTSSMMGDLEGSDINPGAASLAEWAERLSLLAKPNKTYREYLQGFGVSDRNIAGFPEPLMIKRVLMRPYGGAQSVGGPVLYATTQAGTAPGFNAESGQWSAAGTQLNNVNTRMAGVSGIGTLHTHIDETRKRRLIVDEPSIILGTVCFYLDQVRTIDFAHHMDISRLIAGQMWGDESADELGFIAGQDVRGAFNRGTIPGRQPPSAPVIFNGFSDDGTAPPYVMNSLNLFLNGDVFTNDPYAFGARPPGSSGQGSYDATTTLPTAYYVEGNGEMFETAIGRFSMGVATDLVS